MPATRRNNRADAGTEQGPTTPETRGHPRPQNSPSGDLRAPARDLRPGRARPDETPLTARCDLLVVGAASPGPASPATRPCAASGRGRRRPRPGLWHILALEPSATSSTARSGTSVPLQDRLVWASELLFPGPPLPAAVGARIDPPRSAAARSGPAAGPPASRRPSPNSACRTWPSGPALGSEHSPRSSAIPTRSPTRVEVDHAIAVRRASAARNVTPRHARPVRKDMPLRTGP